jgi:SAM-dependent methyltransferase
MPRARRSRFARRVAARKRPLARGADRYDLYQRAVQAPEFDVHLLRRFYAEALPGREPLVMREDFCAAASLSCGWVRSRLPREAHGVDLDPEPLEWGRTHNLAALRPAWRERVHLHQGDVREVRTPPADVVNALNFSFCVFKTRADLLGYFRSAYRNLKREGILVLDLFGGYEVLQERRDTAVRHGSFSHVWEQHSFDPLTHFGTYFLHFRFRDGSEMKRAFRYDWRLWTIPELRELLAEAGFARSLVYWEDATADGEGSGRYRVRERGEPDAAWIVYIAGLKHPSA